MTGTSLSASHAMTVAGMIPANQHGGFVAVAVRFPADPAAHRVERLYHPSGGTTGGVAATFDGRVLRSSTETRPACRPDSDPGERLYELSVPSALARGAMPCGHPECFGGDPC
jgi:hypothetical protein